jgi:hypothetical protein
MEWMTKRGEAEPYPDGTRIKSKDSGSEGVIEKQCGCGSGDWLHYEVRMNDTREKYSSVYQHPAIERLFEVVSQQ